MKRYLSLFLVSILFMSCTQAQNCPEGINLLPMYGKVKKCSDQIQYDNEFLRQLTKSIRTENRLQPILLTEDGSTITKEKLILQ